MNSVIIEIIEDNALSYSKILIGVFNYWFLEVTKEFQNLSIILEPLWSNLGDGVLDLIFTDSNAAWDDMWAGLH